MALPVRPAYRLYLSLWAGLDLLFPPTCVGCGKGGTRWCDDCQKTVRLVLPPVCDLCGRGLESCGICIRCQEKNPHFSGVRSWATFEGHLRKALHQLKYNRDISLGVVMARPMIHMLRNLNWEIDLVTPVPLGVARLKERGYNQSGLLAKPLALEVGLPYRPQALKKIRNTPTQVNLSLSARRDNVKGAFESDSRLVRGRNVLVVDDVATSSATLDACSVALLEAGATQVYGLTLARAGHF